MTVTVTVTETETETATVTADTPWTPWRAAALDAPRVFDAPCGTALLRQQPEDFRVDERLSFEPSGSGSHVLLQVEKRDANTVWVAKKIAAEARVRVQDVGFAGLKDRHALTRQWFSVPARGRSAGSWEGFEGEGFVVRAASLHGRKLPRGALKGNRFRIVLRSVAGPKEIFEYRLATLASEGIANYFGPQRFGREAGNLRELASALAQGPRRERPAPWLVSTARSLIFNAVLAERVRLGHWSTLLEGERANLDGSNSSFVVDYIDDTIKERLARLDIHPTGPLAGINGKAEVAGEIATLEARILADYAPVCDWLAAIEVEASRRPLRARVEDLRYRWLVADSNDEAVPDPVGGHGLVGGASLLGGASLELEFGLRSGSFATALLRELIDVAEGLPEGAEG